MEPGLAAILFGVGFVVLMFTIYGILCLIDVPDFGGVSEDDEETVMICMMASCI